MSRFFTKALGALSFASSQVNDSNAKNPDTMGMHPETPFKSSHAHLDMKATPPSKEKQKKHQQSLEQGQELEGFGRDEELQENSTSIMRDVNGADGIVKSAKKAGNSSRKGTAKNEQAYENGNQEEATPHNSGPTLMATSSPSTGALDSPNQKRKRRKKKKKRNKSRQSFESNQASGGPRSEQLPNEPSNHDAAIESPRFNRIASLQNGGLPSNKRQRKKARQSLQFSRQADGIDLQEAEAPSHVAESTPVRSSPNGGDPVISITKSKKKRRRRSSLHLALDIHDTPAQEEETEAMATPSHTSNSQRKSKKEKQSGLTLEVVVNGDQQEQMADSPVDQTERTIGEDGDENTALSESVLTSKQLRRARRDKLIDTRDENLTDVPEQGNVKTRKLKKYEAAKTPPTSLDNGSVVDAPTDADEHEFSNLGGLDSGSEDRQESEQNVEESEQSMDVIAPKSGPENSTRSGNNTESTIEELEDADESMLPPAAKKKSKSKKKKSGEADEVTTFGKTTNAQAIAITPKLQKSKHHDREEAFLFGHLEDEESDDVPHESLLEESTSSSPEIGSQDNPIKQSSKNVGVNDSSRSKASRSSDSRGSSSGDKDVGENMEDVEPPALDSSEEQDAVETPSVGLKRKRSAATFGDVKSEAPRLPLKRRRPTNFAARLTEEREPSPEALRIPEKKRVRKSKAAPKKSNGKAADDPALESTGMKKGAFTKEEEETMSRALVKYGEMHDKTEREVRDILHANARANANTSALLQELYGALPDRTNESIVKVARRKFHNFPRYGQWTEDEDEDLRVAFEKFGNAWVKISSALNRHHEDVRDRYRNYVVCGSNLDKGPWTKAEEDEMMKFVDARLAKLRAKAGRWYEKEIARGKTDYDMLDWPGVSKDMGLKRSRLGCQQKYKQITDRMASALGASWGEDPETQSWRTKKAKAEVQLMEPGDKLMFLRGIQRAGYGREEKIQFDKVGDQDLKDHFTEKAKKLYLKFLRLDTPGGGDMTLQELVSRAIEDLENDFPDRLTLRYDPKMHGESVPKLKRKRIKFTSSKRVTASDDEDDEEEPRPERKSRLRDRMERQSEIDEDGDEEDPKPKNKAESRGRVMQQLEIADGGSTAKRSRGTTSKTTLSEERVQDETDGDEEIVHDEMDVDEDHDVDGGHDSDDNRDTEMPDGDIEVKEETSSESPSPSQEEQPKLKEIDEIEDSDVGEPSFNRSHQYTSQQEMEDDVVEEQSDAKSVENSDSENNTPEDDEVEDSSGEENGNTPQDYEVEDSDSEEEAKEKEKERERSIASSRGREFRLGKGVNNLEDVEISSDDSDEDIPSVRPEDLPRTTRLRSRKGGLFGRLFSVKSK